MTPQEKVFCDIVVTTFFFILISLFLCIITDAHSNLIYRIICTLISLLAIGSMFTYVFYDITGHLPFRSNNQSIKTKTIMETQSPTQQQPQIIVVNSNQSNGCGTAGFIFALLSICLCWAPVAGWLIWFLGLSLSFVGLFKEPRGLAVAGFILSVIDLIILIMIIGTIGVGLAALMEFMS